MGPVALPPLPPTTPVSPPTDEVEDVVTQVVVVGAVLVGGVAVEPVLPSSPVVKVPDLCAPVVGVVVVVAVVETIELGAGVVSMGLGAVDDSTFSFFTDFSFSLSPPAPETLELVALLEE